MENMIVTGRASAILPSCDWVYFATPSRGSWTVTAEFVSETKTIIRNVHNSKGERIANVSRLEPGDKILLAYGGSGRPYRPLFAATIAKATIPVQGPKRSFEVFACIDESLWGRLRDSGYTPDPSIEKFVGIAITDIADLRHLSFSIPRPGGNNTIRRWAEVFG
jgi:hypothetical protein